MKLVRKLRGEGVYEKGSNYFLNFDQWSVIFHRLFHATFFAGGGGRCLYIPNSWPYILSHWLIPFFPEYFVCPEFLYLRVFEPFTMKE